MDPNTVPDAFGDELYRSIAPLAYDDPNRDYALKTICYALAKPFAQAWELVRADGDGHEPWERIMNPDIAPDYVLPYIAMFVGVSIPVGTDAATGRQLIANASGMNRGTPASIIAAAQLHLTGTKFTLLQERDTSAYHLSLVVRTSETDLATGTYEVTEANASLSSLIRALYDVKPAGLVFNLVVVPGITINELTGTIDALPNTIDNTL